MPSVLGAKGGGREDSSICSRRWTERSERQGKLCRIPEKMDGFITARLSENFSVHVSRGNWSTVPISFFSVGASFCIAVLVILLFSKASMALANNLFISRQQPVWHEDAAFRAAFGDLLDALNSDDTTQVMHRYDQKAPHVTHFCFLVHGLSAFSKVNAR